MNDAGHVVLRTRLTRDALMPFLPQWPLGIIGLAVRGGAQDWARRFHEPGPTAQRLAPQVVPPSVQSHKNDPGDAEALCEAVTGLAKKHVKFPHAVQPFGHVTFLSA
jgi:hypothetical protein